MKLKPEILNGKRVILASKSPRRKELLSLICDSFEVMPADIDESVPQNVAAEEAAEYISIQKAFAIDSEDVIIACDTVVIVDGKILGKPSDRQNGFEMLSELSGKTHSVISGVCIRYKGESVSFSQKSLVTFYELTDEEINDYLDSGEPFDKAGGYGIQGLGSLLVKEFSGDFFNIVGLPVARLRRSLSELLSKAEEN
ncbi:MAG: septum formation protein Maf [Oscillospiraceae bacterium]|nr:septum formation protein Maf [Oscillospiraceae bacterium]